MMTEDMLAAMDDRNRAREARVYKETTVEGLAQLIREDPEYLRAEAVVNVIRDLRGAAARAKTAEARDRAKRSLETLAAAVVGLDQRGQRFTPDAETIAETYGRLRDAYRDAKATKHPKLSPVHLPPGYLPPTGPLPKNVTAVLFDSKNRPKNVIHPEERPNRGRIAAYEYFFTIPKEDLDRLNPGRRGGATPGDLATERAANVLGVGEEKVRRTPKRGGK
jgi:hypothetical protein